MKKWIISIVVILAALFGTAGYLMYSRHMTVPFLYRMKAGNQYTIVTAYSKSPLEIDTLAMQPLDWENFPQHPMCKFMADPFIIRDSNDFYIFYEEMPSKMNSTWGDLAVMHSTDLEHWERLGVILDEPFHLSFPNVFRYKSEWYMIPETGAIHEVRIYKAVDFPMKWAYAHTLFQDDFMADAAIIERDGVWYLLYSSSIGFRLCYADDLFADWHEHPSSPIRIEDGKQETRPAGNFIECGDSLYYVVQRHDGGYGTSVVAYQIDSLSPEVFIEHRLEHNPVVDRYGNGYAKDGMHQLSSIYLPEKNMYFCVMDGNRVSSKNEWGWDWKNWPKFRF